jgi:hypothetical protein
MNVPDSFNIGDTWEWEESLADYPASVWTLTFYFVNAANTVTIAASASGDDHAVSVAPATTNGYTAGRYRWTARVTDGSDIFTVGNGWSDVYADPTAAQDARSASRITLDAIEATLQGRATTDDLSVSINGRAISRIPISELRQWRDELREQVRVEEETEAAVGSGRDIRVRFNRV